MKEPVIFSRMRQSREERILIDAMHKPFISGARKIASSLNHHLLLIYKIKILPRNNFFK